MHVRRYIYNFAAIRRKVKVDFAQFLLFLYLHKIVCYQYKQNNSSGRQGFKDAVDRRHYFLKKIPISLTVRYYSPKIAL